MKFLFAMFLGAASWWPALVLPQPHECPGSTSLPGAGSVEQILIEDLDANGSRDLLAVHHGASTATLYLQREPRTFKQEHVYRETGFHPYDIVSVPKTDRFLLLAQGQKKLRAFKFDDKFAWQDISSRKHPKPRFAAWFTWPKWGQSLVISPQNGEVLMLLPSPDTEQLDKGPIVLARKIGASVPGEIAVTDIDGDKIDDLVYTTRRNSTVWMLQHNGAKPNQKNAPQPKKLWEFASGYPRQVAAQDIDHDGDIDLVAPLESDGKIALLLNDGSGKLKVGNTLDFPVKTGPRVIQSARLRDGRTLLAVSAEKSLVFYTFDVTGEPISQGVVHKMPGTPVFHRILDIDADGFMDIIAGLGSVKDAVKIIYGPFLDKKGKVTSSCKGAAQ